MTAARNKTKSRHDPRWTLAACVLASSLSFVEGSVLNVALPAIRVSYGAGAGAAEVQWVINAYLLPLSALLLLGGALGDHYGRRLLLLIGTGLFAATSLVCALAMMPLGMFADRCFSGLNLLTFLLYVAFGAAMLLIPYVLSSAGGYSPVEAGLAMLPLPILLTLASPLMGKFAGRLGPRWFLIVGPLVVAAGMLLGRRIGADTEYWTSVFPAMAVMAAGLAIAVAPLTASVLGSVDEKHVGTASGFNSAVARTGGLIATAMLGIVLSRDGEALIAGLHLSLIGAAVAAAAASAVAVVMVRGVRMKSA